MCTQFDIDFTKLSIDDIRAILDQSGYFTNAPEFYFAKKNDYFKYIGTVDHQVRYLVAFESDETEGQMYVSIIFVHLYNGKIGADYGGVPVFESFSEDEIAAYIEKRCN